MSTKGGQTNGYEKVGKEGLEEKGRTGSAGAPTQEGKEGGEEAGREEALIVDSQDQKVLDALYQIKLDRQAYGEAITSQVRAISIGILAIVWVLLNGIEKALADKFDSYSHSLLWIALTVIGALVADMAQLVISYRSSHKAYRSSALATRLSEVTYPANSKLLKAAYWLFVLKIGAVFGAAAWLLATIAAVLIR